MYVQSRNDDGGFASRGLAPLGDFAAVSSLSEFVEVLRPKSSQSDDATIRRGSMTSVPAVPGNHHTDTHTRAVHTLNVRLSGVVLQDDTLIGAAA